MTISASITLPQTQRPDVAAVVTWYEHTLRSQGALVQRAASDELEFATDPINFLEHGNWEPNIGTVSGGQLVVEPTPAGFMVRARVEPRLWLVALPLVQIAFITGGLSLSQEPLKYLVAFGGLPLVLGAWGFAIINILGVLRQANRAIETSYTLKAAAQTSGCGAVAA